MYVCMYMARHSMYICNYVSTFQMGLVMTKSNSYIIHPVESGVGEGSPHIMFNANDWSMINGTKQRIHDN